LASIGNGHRRVFWDEEIHGHRASSRSAFEGPLGWLFLQLGGLTLAVLLTYSRRSGPIVSPAAERRLSPLEFVRTLGALYERAGAASAAVEILYQRFRYWLARRLGLSPAAPIEELERVARERLGHLGAEFVSTLRECESARTDPRLSPHSALRLSR